MPRIRLEHGKQLPQLFVMLWFSGGVPYPGLTGFLPICCISGYETHAWPFLPMLTCPPQTHVALFPSLASLPAGRSPQPWVWGCSVCPDGDGRPNGPSHNFGALGRYVRSLSAQVLLTRRLVVMHYSERRCLQPGGPICGISLRDLSVLHCEFLPCDYSFKRRDTSLL
jgi:hypothetical protein